jgi:hypothetical protein
MLWLDQGWQPTAIGFALSKRAMNRFLKEKGWGLEDVPHGAAHTHHFHGDCVIVCLFKETRRVSRIQIAGLLAHEAVHVWQAVRRDMNEKAPAVEQEAYAVQAIFQSLYRTWFDVRGHRMKPDARNS